MRSRFSTTRERPLASAARIESSPPLFTSMRRWSRARPVFGRSKEIRAGLSIVKSSGSEAGPDSVIVTCMPLPGIGCTSTDCSIAAGVAAALAVVAAKLEPNTTAMATRSRRSVDEAV